MANVVIEDDEKCDVDFVDSVEDQNTQLPDIVIYPNPFTNELKIDIDKVTNLALTLSMVDVLGQEVFNELLPKEDDKYKVDLSEMEAGIYIIRIKLDNNQAFTSKVIKI